MNITVKSSSGEYNYNAFTENDYWVIQRVKWTWLGNTYDYIGKAYSRQGVMDLCVNRTPGNNARVVSGS